MLFVIIGIVVLIAFSLYIYITVNLEKKGIVQEPALIYDAGSSANLYVTNCVSDLLVKSVDLYGLRDISSLEGYVDNNLKSCADFNEFTIQGFDVEAGDVSSDIVLSGDEKNLYTTVNYPVAISKGDFETKLYNFYSELFVQVSADVDTDD